MIDFSLKNFAGRPDSASGGLWQDNIATMVSAVTAAMTGGDRDGDRGGDRGVTAAVPAAIRGDNRTTGGFLQQQSAI